MKKLLFTAIIILTISNLAFSDGKLEAGLGLGTAGIGVDIGFELLDLYVQFDYPAIGFIFTFFKYSYSFIYEEKHINIFKTTFYWNMLGDDPTKVFFGAYFSIYPLNINLDSTGDFNGLVFGAGFKWHTLFGIDVGYKYNNGRHQAVFMFNASFLGLMSLFF